MKRNRLCLFFNRFSVFWYKKAAQQFLSEKLAIRTFCAVQREKRMEEGTIKADAYGNFKPDMLMSCVSSRNCKQGETVIRAGKSRTHHTGRKENKFAPICIGCISPRKKIQFSRITFITLIFYQKSTTGMRNEQLWLRKIRAPPPRP